MQEKLNYLWTDGRGLYFLVGLLCLGIFVSPLMISIDALSDIGVECVFALILIAGVFATPCSPWVRGGMLLIAAAAVLARIWHKFDPLNLLVAGTDNMLAIISLVAFCLLIMQHFLLSKCLLRHRITAAVGVYLILGMIWARIFELVYLLNPAAFSTDHAVDSFSLIYFSFVTLLTIGYGDIAPISIAARSLAILEGVVGQLYLVILISSLVSEFSALAIKCTKEEI